MVHREMRRVPLDFDAPLGEVWEGYRNPWRDEIKDCPDCDNGYTPAAMRIKSLSYLIIMSADDAYNGSNHPWTDNLPLDTNKKMDYKEMSQFTSGLAGREHSMPWGHEAMDQWKAYGKILEAAGVPDDWGLCQTCDGEGQILPEDYDPDWEFVDPPTGKGYQLWETTSEGSPKSPVFKTMEELADWCEDNASTFASYRATKEEWLKMFKENYIRHETQFGNTTVIF